MADNLATIAFNNTVAGFNNAGAATISGSLNVDYTTSLSTGMLKIVAAGVTETYTNPSVGTSSTGVHTILAYGDTKPKNNSIIIQWNGDIPATANITIIQQGNSYGQNDEPVTSHAVCFVTGTLIKTVDGLIAVQQLRVGDKVVTASGEHRPIRWIGSRDVNCRRYAEPRNVMPVRICAEAFGPTRPSRDLVVSPGHSICIDAIGEVLIPIIALVNGTTIRQESVDRVTYWHVELEGGHDILLAENLPTESYLDMGNRGFFPRPGEAMALHGMPDAAPATHADFCRPFHAAGLVVDFVRDRLAARALQLDWTQVENPLADLHLVIDGCRVEAEVQGLSARFLVPATAETVWLQSDTVVPAMAGGGADLRTLGVCVGKLVVSDGFGSQVVMADDPRLCAGFHCIEEGPQRWTAGHARLPAELWEGCRGSFFLRVELTRPALPTWVSPNVVDRKDRVALAY